jgi:hypothetical protein
MTRLLSRDVAGLLSEYLGFFISWRLQTQLKTYFEFPVEIEKQWKPYHVHMQCEDLQQLKSWMLTEINILNKEDVLCKWLFYSIVYDHGELLHWVTGPHQLNVKTEHFEKHALNTTTSLVSKTIIRAQILVKHCIVWNKMWFLHVNEQRFAFRFKRQSILDTIEGQGPQHPLNLVSLVSSEFLVRMSESDLQRVKEAVRHSDLRSKFAREFLDLPPVERQKQHNWRETSEEVLDLSDFDNLMRDDFGEDRSRQTHDLPI